MAKEKIYDVVIFDFKTRTVESVAGKDMTMDTGFFNARKRLETVLPRLNQHYGVMIVPAGLFDVGSKLPRIKAAKK